MSTKNAPEAPHKPQPDILKPPTKVDSSSEIIASLEEKLVAAQDAHCEERFLWLAAVAGLLFAVLALSGLSAPIMTIIFVLIVIILTGAAKMWGIDWAIQLMEWARSTITRSK